VYLHLDAHDGQGADQGADTDVDEDRLRALSGGYVENQYAYGGCACHKVQEEPCTTAQLERLRIE
jgi:hypothetical protein